MGTRTEFTLRKIIHHQNILIIGTIVYAGFQEAKKRSAVNEEFENC
jgi:hypothetical protein